MERVAVIGAGISGLSVAHLLQERYDVTVFEKDSLPGGLIKCCRIKGSLFHTCGGHVFNTKRKSVLDWFWSKFSREEEFTEKQRNSVILNDVWGGVISYPLENHIYAFDADTQKAIIDDLIAIAKNGYYESKNFEDFLRNRFGNTLYDIYFKPYNEKIWRRNLKNVPLSWLEGKLPMPTVSEIIYNNINHVKEKEFVHSTFWYEKENGSQYIADKLSNGLNIQYNVNVTSIKKDKDKWIVCGGIFDKVVFCGNIKDMIKSVEGVDIHKYMADIEALEYHGTTAVFCEIDKNPYSWIYLPSSKHESHRIICTGNFADSNNQGLRDGRITATVEFTDKISKEEITDNLTRIPLNPKYLAHQYNQYTYPIQDANTRTMIRNLKKDLAATNFYFTGRFSDWEYYNMDTAIGAAMDLCATL